MTNPFIEGFLKIEEARKNSENIFNEAKKLTAAQKRELDKNDNDKIDAEDFEMLRKEEAEEIDEAEAPRGIAAAQRAAARLTSNTGGAFGSMVSPSIVNPSAGQTPAAAVRSNVADTVTSAVRTPVRRDPQDAAPRPNLSEPERRSALANIANRGREIAAERGQERRTNPAPTTTPERVPSVHDAETDVGTADSAQNLARLGRDSDNDGAADAATTRNVTRDSRDTPPTPTRVNAKDINPGTRMGRADADEIRAAQSALGITADGIAGPQTRQAIMDFQRERGLQVDGIMGDQTRTALRQMIAANNRDRIQSPNMMADSFSPAELEHINSILEAMPVAPTDSGDSPNPTPRKKAEGSRSKGSLAD
jgi:hypothetical protein